MACIPPNPRRVGYIDPIHGPLDEPLYIGSHIHQQACRKCRRRKSFCKTQGLGQLANGECLILVCRSVITIYNAELSFLKKKMENVLFQYTSWQILLLKTHEHSWQKMEPPTSKHVRHILNLKMEGYFQYKYATKETHKQKHSLQVQKHLQLSSFCVVAIRRIQGYICLIVANHIQIMIMLRLVKTVKNW